MFNNFLERVYLEESAGFRTTIVSFLIGIPVVLVLGYLFVRGVEVVLNVIGLLLTNLFLFLATKDISDEQALVGLIGGVVLGVAGFLVGWVILILLAEKNHIRNVRKELVKTQKEWKEYQKMVKDKIEVWDNGS